MISRELPAEKLLPVSSPNFYGEDWKKWTNLEQAKAQSEQKLIENLGGMWAKYFENQLAAFKLTKDALEILDKRGSTQLKSCGDGSEDESLPLDESSSPKPLQDRSGVKSGISMLSTDSFIFLIASL